MKFLWGLRDEYKNHHEDPYAFGGLILGQEIDSEGSYFYPKDHSDNWALGKTET